MTRLSARRARARQYRTLRQHMTQVAERYVLASSIILALYLLRAAS